MTNSKHMPCISVRERAGMQRRGFPVITSYDMLARLARGMLLTETPTPATAFKGCKRSCDGAAVPQMPGLATHGALCARVNSGRVRRKGECRTTAKPHERNALEQCSIKLR